MGSVDIRFIENCPNCKKEIDFDVDFYLYDTSISAENNAYPICEHCGAELHGDCSIDVDKYCKLSVYKMPLIERDVIPEDEPYHSNDPNQLSIL